jgi:hypothetical protein
MKGSVEILKLEFLKGCSKEINAQIFGTVSTDQKHAIDFLKQITLA